MFETFFENSNQISFYDLKGKSNAKSLQLQIEYNYSNLLNLNLVYKNYDVRQDYISGYLQKPLLAKNRFFVNLGIESKLNPSKKKFRLDITYNLIGSQRLVETLRDKSNSFSPSYSLWNSQITKTFSKKIQIYMGSENIGNYNQSNPIIGIEDPFSTNFDASQIYAPIFGGMIYLGIRINS